MGWYNQLQPLARGTFDLLWTQSLEHTPLLSCSNNACKPVK
jgi:hypothetical protein